MPRTKFGSPPSYRLYKRTGQAVVTIDGHDYYLGAYGTPASRQKYAAYIRAWEKSNLQQEPNPSSDSPTELLVPEHTSTINDLVLAYLKHAISYYKPSANGERKEASCIADAVEIVRQLYGREPADAFGPKALKLVREKMIEKKWSRQYINRQVGRVKRMFAFATEEEMIPGHVYHALLAVKGLKKNKLRIRESKKVRPAPIVAVKEVLKRAHPILAAMIRFQFLTGCRPCELCSLKPYHLERAAKAWIYTVPPDANKTECHDQERKVFIGPRAQRVLKPLLDIPADDHVFSPARAEVIRNEQRRLKRQTPRWPSHVRRQATKRQSDPKRTKRDHYDTASYRRAVKRLCDIANVERWHPNQLRHNAATRFRKKYGIELARILLGHRKLTTTEIYAEADWAKARKVAGRIG